jgi:predicted RNase H-like HicB family nuclease
MMAAFPFKHPVESCVVHCRLQAERRLRSDQPWTLRLCPRLRLRLRRFRNSSIVTAKINHSAEARRAKATVVCSRREYDEEVNLTIDLDREEDGRCIAEALEIPGVMCYGETRDEAIGNVELLAIDVIADRIAHGELPSSALGVSFTIPDEQLALQ